MFLLTLNTWKCEGDYELRIGTMARHISVIQPDILMLQEVFCAPEVNTDTLKYIRPRLVDHHCLPAIARNKVRRFKGRDVQSLSGLATFVRGELLESRVIPLPDCEEDRDRCAQVNKVVWNGHVLQIVNLHLSHVRGANELRKRQLEVILGELEALPVIIGGDFNSRPDSLPMNFLRENMDEVVVPDFATGPGGGVIDYFAWKDLPVRRANVEPLFDGTNLPVVTDHTGVGLHLDIPVVKKSA